MTPQIVRNLLLKPRWSWATILVIAASAFFIGGAAGQDRTVFGPTVAAWVQACGAILAIWGAASLSRQAAAEAAAREERDRQARRIEQLETSENRLIVARALLSTLTQRFKGLSSNLRGSAGRIVRVRRAVVAGIRSILGRMEAYPLHDLPDRDAVRVFVLSERQGQTILSTIEDTIAQYESDIIAQNSQTEVNLRDSETAIIGLLDKFTENMQAADEIMEAALGVVRAQLN